MLKERLNADLKVAMKSGDTAKKTIIRVILSEMDFLSKKGVEATDAELEKLIIKQIKAAETINNDEAKAEIVILSEYLPKKLSEDETRDIVTTLIGELKVESMRDMGKLMEVLAQKYGNTIDKKLVSEIVKSKLS